ncbi:MAG: hypothetical protein MUO42_10975 [Anaerolineaceae bacterium]|nr:hypothetical protein [Anaerolineaceae bacterium]
MVGRHHSDLANLAQFLDHGQQAGMENAIVVSCENMHEFIYPCYAVMSAVWRGRSIMP